MVSSRRLRALLAIAGFSDTAAYAGGLPRDTLIHKDRIIVAIPGSGGIAKSHNILAELQADREAGTGWSVNIGSSAQTTVWRGERILYNDGVPELVFLAQVYEALEQLRA